MFPNLDDFVPFDNYRSFKKIFTRKQILANKRPTTDLTKFNTRWYLHDFNRLHQDNADINKDDNYLVEVDENTTKVRKGHSHKAIREAPSNDSEINGISLSRNKKRSYFDIVDQFYPRDPGRHNNHQYRRQHEHGNYNFPEVENDGIAGGKEYEIDTGNNTKNRADSYKKPATIDNGDLNYIDINNEETNVDINNKVSHNNYKIIDANNDVAKDKEKYTKRNRENKHKENSHLEFGKNDREKTGQGAGKGHKHVADSYECDTSDEPGNYYGPGIPALRPKQKPKEQPDQGGRPGRPGGYPGRPGGQPGRPKKYPGRPKENPGRSRENPRRPGGYPGIHEKPEERPVSSVYGEHYKRGIGAIGNINNVHNEWNMAKLRSPARASEVKARRLCILYAQSEYCIGKSSKGPERAPAREPRGGRQSYPAEYYKPVTIPGYVSKDEYERKHKEATGKALFTTM